MGQIRKLLKLLQKIFKKRIRISSKIVPAQNEKTLIMPVPENEKAIIIKTVKDNNDNDIKVLCIFNNRCKKLIRWENIKKARKLC